MSKAVVRAMEKMSAELGFFSSALVLMDVSSAIGAGSLPQQIQDIRRKVPVFDAILRQGKSYTEIKRRLRETIYTLDEHLDEIDTVIVTAIEADLIDELVDRFPAISVLAVAHDESADRVRIESNYSPNFRVITATEVQQFAHPIHSLLLVPGFGFDHTGSMATYPAASRILGRDTNCLFADIVGIDLLGSSFHYYPHMLVEISRDSLTAILKPSSTAAQYEENPTLGVVMT